MSQYFATLPPDQLILHIRDRIKEYDNYLEESGKADLYRRAAQTYYGLDAEGRWAKSSAVTYGGEQGELAMARINHFRSIVDQRNIHTTGARPSPEAIATNATYDAAQAAKIAEKILEYDLAHGALEDAFVEQSKRESIGGEGWLSQTWDPNGGDDYAVQAAGPGGYRDAASAPGMVKTGEVRTRVVDFYDVIRDINRRDTAHQWLIERRYVNRWDLVALYPEMADQIIAMAEEVTREWTSSRALWQPPDQQGRNSVRDIVIVYDFYHAKTPAVPAGRMLSICAGMLLGLDQGLPYDEIPLHMFAEDVEPDRPFGHTRNFDLLVPQQIVDSTTTTMLSNHDAFGVQNIISPNNSDIEVEDLSGGLRFIKYNYTGPGSEPKALQLLQTSEHSYKLQEIGEQAMEKLSAINSVARGDPQASLKSGSALALVQSMAIQGNSGRTTRYVKNVETVLSARIRLYQQFATTERVIQVVGEDGRTSVMRFMGEKLGLVKKISVGLASPLMRTTTGRKEVADSIVERFPNQVTPAQYMTMLETGRLEPITEQPTAEPIFIKLENEKLRVGEPQRVLASDDHQLHWQEHKCLTFDPEVRGNEALMEIVLQHMAEHQQFIQAETMAAAPPANDNAADPGAPANDNGGAPKAKPIGIDTTANEGIAGKMPAMPKNALTGEAAQPTGT